MYIQITTRCNMKCAHCCFSCTSKGVDMTYEIFKKSLDLGFEEISIGGGEPTLHQLFEKFIFYALGKSMDIWIATNGSDTEKSMALANMAKVGILRACLSLDRFHDPIDEKVVDAFKKSIFDDMCDLREIREDAIVLNAGRAKLKKNQKKYNFVPKNDCPCNDIFVDPKGYVHGCGCKNSPIFGNVLYNNVVIPEYWIYGECYKDQDEY